MSWWCDILRQCVFMSFFIIPIPIGSYTIHNGSSAVVAMVSYTLLSLAIPWAYLGCKGASFGTAQRPISRTLFVIMWLALQGILAWFGYFMGGIWKGSSFWEWPTVGRDILFIAGMYGQVALTMILAYIATRLTGQTQKEGQA
ncbi:MAG: hypothetical protein LKF47_06555 [Megasphaera sp.]|jgi:hypothetical protein|nr:hypothetical protein [Megasphaera sp.]MCI1248337.1 hypothetical protein [Megasphaera sp.]